MTVILRRACPCTRLEGWTARAVAHRSRVYL